MICTLVALAALGACGPSHARLRYAELESPAMRGADMDYGVYTPPDFAEGERLPLVVFLHGAGDGPSAFDRHGVSAALDAAITRGEIPRVVIITPQGDLGFWANWFDESRRYEDWVVDDLMPEVARELGTLPCPEHCHVLGISMGGWGALKFAQHRPDRFASVAVLSGPIFDAAGIEDLSTSVWANLFVPVRRAVGPFDPARVAREDPYMVWRAPADLYGVRVMLAWGDAESGAIGTTGARFSAHLERAGIPHVRRIFPGGHDWDAWIPVFAPALRFAIWSDPDGRAKVPGT